MTPTPTDVVRSFYNYNLDYQFVRVALSPSATSCAQVGTVWSTHFADSVEVTIGEQLRVLDLLRHPALSPAAFQLYLNIHSDRCPLDRWCAFCDEGRRDVVAHLYWEDGRNVEALYKALLGWTEAKASTGFRQLKQAVQAVQDAAALSTSDRSRWTQRVSPIKLSVCFQNMEWREAHAHCRRLQALLEQRSPGACFRVVCGPHANMDTDELEFLSDAFPAALAKYDWSSLLSPVVSTPQDDDSKATWDPSTSALVTENVVALDVRITTVQDAQRLHEILRSQPTALRTLVVGFTWYFYIDDCTVQRLWGDLVEALFLHRSQAALRQFTLSRVNDAAMLAMLNRLASNTAAAPSRSRGNRLSHFTCSCWHWTVMRGATLAELVQGMGGVDSLRLQEREYHCPQYAIPIFELPDLVQRCESLRSLDADVACAERIFTRYPIPAWSRDGDVVWDTSSRSHHTSLERLCLRPIDNDAAVAQPPIERLLQCVGHSLVSLSLVPYQADFRLNGEMAKAIVRHCPKLQQLKVARVHATFIKELVRELEAAGDGVCPLQRLEFTHQDADVDMSAPLFAALSSPTHPLTCSLRSLRLILKHFADDKDMKRVAVGARDVLAMNRHLTEIAIYSTTEWRIEPSLVLPPTVAVLPPMRHRLAVWSVLRPRNLPRDVLWHVLTMLSHHFPRLRLLHGPPNDTDDEW